MSLQDEIITLMRATQAEDGVRPLQEAKGRTWLQSLQGTLSQVSVKDRTDYRNGRSYCLDCHLPQVRHSAWQYMLRIRISGIGPFASQVFLQVSPMRRWWSGPVRTGRSGLDPAHVTVMDAVRNWYRDKGLTEVDVFTQAEPVPADIAPAKNPDEPVLLYRLLFGI